ncbi:MAG: hypothetical protein JXQ96_09330 [Cyclobacteriaceae bacterium]
MNEKYMRKCLMIIGVLVAIFVSQHSSVAQEVEITDEELTTYAAGMNKIDSIKTDMSEKYKQMIKDEAALKGRFNDMKKAYGNDDKLAEINATDEEIAAYEKIQVTYEEMKANLKETSVEIIKGDIGAGIYNKVKKALKTDTELKAKYEEILKSLQPASEDDA